MPNWKNSHQDVKRHLDYPGKYNQKFPHVGNGHGQTNAHALFALSNAEGISLAGEIAFNFFGRIDCATSNVWPPFFNTSLQFYKLKVVPDSFA